MIILKSDRLFVLTNKIMKERLWTVYVTKCYKATHAHAVRWQHGAMKRVGQTLSIYGWNRIQQHNQPIQPTNPDVIFTDGRVILQLNDYVNDADNEIDLIDNQIKQLKEKLGVYNNILDNENITPERRQQVEGFRDSTDSGIKKLYLKRERVIIRRQSFINRMKQWVNGLFNRFDLRRRIRSILTVKGLTVAGIVLTFGAILTSIITSVSPSSSSPSPTDPPDDPSPTPSNGETIGDWFKKKLSSFAKFLKSLAGKALIALPGVIGSIVSFLLKSTASAFGFIAQNVLWFILAIGAFALSYLVKELKS